MFESPLLANIFFIVFGVMLLYSLVTNFTLEQVTLVVLFSFLTKLYISQELNLLIHPRYFWMVYSSLVFVYFLILFNKSRPKITTQKKITFVLLNLIFILGTVIHFQPLSSASKQTNFDTTNISQFSRDLRFTNFNQNTEGFELEDWIAVFSIDPEPSKYQDNKIKVTGFYFLNSDGEPMIAKYILSCCAADARIMGVWLTESLPYDPDQWIEIEGTLQEIKIDDIRTIGIKIETHKDIPTPQDPYVTK